MGADSRPRHLLRLRAEATLFTGGGAPDNRDALHIPSHADTIVGNCMEIYNSMLIKKQLHGREHVLCDFIALPYPLWSNSQVLSCAIWEHGPVHVTL